jgi:hypothetical protein
MIRDFIDEGIESKRKHRILIPLEYSDDNDKRKTEVRKKKIKDLMETILSDKEGLWNWKVKWKELIEVKYIRNFIYCFHQF